MFWDEGVNAVTRYSMFGVVGESDATRGRFFMFWNMTQVCGAPVLVGLLAGQAAHEAEVKENDLPGQAMEVLRSIFRDVAVPDPIATKVTSWASDEFAHGSYSVSCANKGRFFVCLWC